MSLFLTADDLFDLTDTKVRHLQMQWLDNHGWTYTKSRMGNPKVLRAYMEQRLGLGTQVLTNEQTEPDWEGFRNRKAA